MSKGKARFLIYPKEAIVRLDSERFEYNKYDLIRLDTGWHNIQIWAPKLEYVQDSFFIPANKPVVYSKKLDYSQEYKAFRKAKGSYRRKKIMLQVLPAVATGTFSLVALQQINDYDQELDELAQDATLAQQQYLLSFSLVELETRQQQFLTAVDEYESLRDRRNTFKVISYSTIAASLAMSYWLFRRGQKLEAPQYHEQPKLSLYNMGLQHNIVDNSLSLNLQFKF